MAKCFICTMAGCSLESSEAISEVKEVLEEWGTDYPNEIMKRDKEWLYRLLSRYIQIHYIRVVKTKPEDGILIKRRIYFEAYLVKRTFPNSGWKSTMVYLKPVQRG